jgi:hypothetical protein
MGCAEVEEVHRRAAVLDMASHVAGVDHSTILLVLEHRTAAEVGRSDHRRL